MTTTFGSADDVAGAIPSRPRFLTFALPLIEGEMMAKQESMTGADFVAHLVILLTLPFAVSAYASLWVWVWRLI